MIIMIKWYDYGYDNNDHDINMDMIIMIKWYDYGYDNND